MKLGINGIFLFFLLTGCALQKRMPAEDVLYNGTEITWSGATAQVKSMAEYIQEDLLRPQPNTQIFGYPYRAALYYGLGKPKKENGLRVKLRRRFAETPVLLSPNLVERQKQLLFDYLQAQGYFRPTIQGQLVYQGKKAEAQFSVHLPPPHYITQVTYREPTQEALRDVFKEIGQESQIVLNRPFQLDQIKAERDRIPAAFRNRGYYFFTTNHLGIEADTNTAQQTIQLTFFIKPDLPIRAQKAYLINDIHVYSDGTTPAPPVDQPGYLFRGVLLEDSIPKYRQQLFTDAIGFRPGTYFSEDLANITRTRLVGLNNFRFVETRYQVVNQLDSSFLNVYYYLSPQKKKSLRTELNAITRSNGLSGSQISLNWRNLNIFKGAELFTVSAIGSAELQAGGRRVSQFRDNYRWGFESTLTLPRFWLPWITIDPETSKILPKTVAQLSYESFIKQGLYNLNSFRASLGYTWRQNARFTHAFTPLSLNLVRSSNFSEAFISEIFQDPRLLTILENQFIPSSTYQLFFTPPATRQQQWSLTTSIDLAGNLAGLIHRLRRPDEPIGRFLGETYAQYARFETDIRHRQTYSSRNQWANRLFVGVGIPYGNSLQLPFVKQYFSGGNNSIRAFRARAVGPGTYARTGNLTEQFLGNNTGDIKLEWNTEWRHKLSDFLETAFFVDAGNVWMYRDPFIYDEGALFKKDFYKDLAVGAGIGLRLDFSFVIFRLDLATPLRKPWQPEGQRWVIREMEWSKPWRQENLVLNLGVGYPF